MCVCMYRRARWSQRQSNSTQHKPMAAASAAAAAHGSTSSVHRIIFKWFYSRSCISGSIATTLTHVANSTRMTRSVNCLLHTLRQSNPVTRKWGNQNVKCHTNVFKNSNSRAVTEVFLTCHNVIHVLRRRQYQRSKLWAWRKRYTI